MVIVSKSTFNKFIAQKPICKRFLYCRTESFRFKQKEFIEHLKFIEKTIDENLKYNVLNVHGILDELKILGIKKQYFELLIGKRITRYNTISRIQRRNQTEFRAALISLKNNINHYIYIESKKIT